MEMNVFDRDFDLVYNALEFINKSVDYNRKFEMNFVDSSTCLALNIYRYDKRLFTFLFNKGNNPLAVFPENENDFWTIKVNDNLKDTLVELLNGIK
jgi:hypothetical protein